jgi:hypothetical protein
MPSLRELTICSYQSNATRDLVLISALPLPGLQFLSVLEVPIGRPRPIEEEDVVPADSDSTQGSHPPFLLTGLTKLEAHMDLPLGSSTPATASQLGRVFEGLSSLQSLTMSFVMPFQPAATALAGLTSLTHLQIHPSGQGMGWEGPLVLPNVRSLHTPTVQISALNHVDAPQLQSMTTGIGYFALGDTPDDLERVCRGQLKPCRDLTLQIFNGISDGTARVMEVLSRAWRPGVSSSSSIISQDSADSSPDCKLCIHSYECYCTQQVLALVPDFITTLHLT